MSAIATTSTTDQTKHTVGLINNLYSIDSNLMKLIRRFRVLQKVLKDLEDILMISKKLADKLGELKVLLLIVEKALMALSGAPYVGPFAKAAQQVVAQIRKVVSQAKKRVDDLEKKIKPHREKIAKFREYIDKIVNKLSKVDGFVKKDNQLVSAAHITTSALPPGRYKNVSQRRLNHASDLQNKILIIPKDILDQVENILSQIDPIIDAIEQLCKIINKVFKPIITVMDELDRVLFVVKDINKVMDKKIYVVLKYMSIKDVLELLDNPVFAAAQKIIKPLLDPLLKQLGMGVVGVPGLGQSVGSLGKVFGKLGEMDKLKNQIIESITLFTGDQNPQKTFKQVDAGKL